MSDRPRFSIIIWTDDTNEVFFRDCIESVASQTFDNWQMYVMDNCGFPFVKRTVSEFFPEDMRVHYRALKSKKGAPYAYNTGVHFIMTDLARSDRHDVGSEYILLLNQHGRLSPEALSLIAGVADGADDVSDWPDIIYTDVDDISGTDRINPDFRTGFNKELLRHRDYIGSFFAVSAHAVRTVGRFNEKLKWAYTYDFLLRAVEKGLVFAHVPALIYHRRIEYDIELRSMRPSERRAYEGRVRSEYMTVVSASLSRQGIEANVHESGDVSYWLIDYNGDDYEYHSRDYMFLKGDGIRSVTADGRNIRRMYGILKQRDVAVVGARFMKRSFAIENCGYIYDSNGITFPAFYDQKIYRPTYNRLASIPRDVSMVDFDYCMIDSRIYRRLGGFDGRLQGRDLMLDYCMRAIERGYRIVVDPAIIVRGTGRDVVSTQESGEYFMEKWNDRLIKEDPFYNRNLPVGLHNFRLDI